MLLDTSASLGFLFMREDSKGFERKTFSPDIRNPRMYSRKMLVISYQSISPSFVTVMKLEEMKLAHPKRFL